MIRARALTLDDRSGQRNLTLLAKSTGDWTRALNSAATMSESMSEKDGFGFGRTVRLSIEGKPLRCPRCHLVKLTDLVTLAGPYGGGSSWIRRYYRFADASISLQDPC
jgi:hypothetical protein